MTWAAVIRMGVAACVLVTAAACSSTAAVDAWAGQVCGALVPWRSQITELNARAQQQMSAATTPEQTRATLLELLAGGEKASETARAAVEAAGVPEVDGGADVARSFTASLAGTRDAYARARAGIEALPTGDTFYDGVGTVMTALNAEYARSGVDTSQLNSPELREAFDRVDRCR